MEEGWKKAGRRYEKAPASRSRQGRYERTGPNLTQPPMQPKERPQGQSRLSGEPDRDLLLPMTQASLEATQRHTHAQLDNRLSPSERQHKTMHTTTGNHEHRQDGQPRNERREAASAT